jgi:hypothetical protein
MIYLHVLNDDFEWNIKNYLPDLFYHAEDLNIEFEGVRNSLINQPEAHILMKDTGVLDREWNHASHVIFRYTKSQISIIKDKRGQNETFKKD